MLSDTKDQIRVVLADDHALVRAGIRALLERIPGVTVLAEAGDGLKTLDLIRRHKPDVVLLDIAMPGLSGLEVLRKIVEDALEVKVIVLTVHETEEYAERSLHLGAAGFLPKSAASAELEHALRMVHGGQQYLSPRSATATPPVSSLQSGSSGGSRSSGPELTPRQKEVLELIAKGLSTKDIARRLNISAKTVETHRAQLMERLQIFDVAGLVRYAIRIGLVTMEE